MVVHGGVVRTSGQLPRGDNGKLVHPGILGVDVTVEQGAEAAGWCARNALSVLRAELGSLDRSERVLTVLGFVACAPGFDAQLAVVDGAGRLLAEVFGPAGRHSRSAVGVSALPRGGAVEVEVAVALRDAAARPDGQSGVGGGARGEGEDAVPAGGGDVETVEQALGLGPGRATLDAPIGEERGRTGEAGESLIES